MSEPTCTCICFVRYQKINVGDNMPRYMVSEVPDTALFLLACARKKVTVIVFTEVMNLPLTEIQRLQHT